MQGNTVAYGPHSWWSRPVSLGGFFLILPFALAGLLQTVARRTRRGLVWLASFTVVVALTAVWFWFLPVALAVSVAAVVDGVLCLRRAPRPLAVFHSDLGIFIVLALAAFAVVGSFALWPFKIPSSSMYPTVHIGDRLFVDSLTPRIHAIERGEVVVMIYPCDPSRDYIKRVVALGGDTVEVRCGVIHVNGKPVPSKLVPGECAYEDYDEETGRWLPRECSQYGETLDGHTYDTYSDPDRPTRTTADPRDFPNRDRPFAPSCHGSQEAYAMSKALPQPEGKLVETKDASSAAACEPQLHYVVPDDYFFAMGDNRSNSNDSRFWGPAPMSAIRGRVAGIYYSSGAHGVELGRIGPIH